MNATSCKVTVLRQSTVAADIRCLTVQWPDNVHIFTQPHLEAMAWPEKRLVLHGAAFTASEQSAGFLSGFAAPKDSNLHIGLLHGEIDPAEARYDPIRKEEIAASGLAYLALGHIHKRTEPLTCGRTVCAWPGCPEGRGFDELGEKGFYAGTIDDTGKVALTERFPEILFEACSSGGNRFDLGTFCYMPQCWTSDDTDALERIYIQFFFDVMP